MKKKLFVLFLANIIILLLVACDNQAELTQLKGHVSLNNLASTSEADYFVASKNRVESQSVLDSDLSLNREEIIIEFGPELSQAKKENLKAEYQLSKLREIEALDLELYQLKQELNQKEFSEYIDSLREEEVIRSVQSNYYLSLESEVKAKSEASNQQWNHQLISLPLVWENNTGSSDMTVAVLDTGIDASHPDLKGQLVPGKSYIESDSDNPDYELGYIDDHGHGTHVAGIVGAADNGSGIRGVSWDSKLMPVKVLGARGGGRIADIISGIIWAADNGADIINLSLGSEHGLGDNLYQAAIDYADQQGSILVSSSGNSNHIKVGHPARYENVIAVGAINQEKQRWSEAFHGSSYGVELDLMAPGKDVYSTLPGGNYGKEKGTSMAAPHVAGVIALILAEEPELSPDEIRRRLIMSAENAGQRGRDLEYGYGIINSYAAVYGAQRDQVKLFLGEKKDGIIQVKKGPTTPNYDGFFKLDLPKGDKYSLYAWVDINGSGNVEAGDYFTSYEVVVDGSFNYKLGLEVLTEEFDKTAVIY